MDAHLSVTSKLLDSTANTTSVITKILATPVKQQLAKEV